VEQETIPTQTSRTERTIQPPKKFVDTEHSSLLCYLSTFYPSVQKNEDNQLLQPNSSLHNKPHPLALFVDNFISLVTTDPDTMTRTEAMNQPDKEQFLLAMKKELEDRIARKHWKVVPVSTVPTHKRCLPMVWSMKRKRNPVGEIIKWKARLCAGGHRSIEFVDYWDTYSPVVCWQTIRLVFILVLMKNWYIHSIDFVLAIPQA
jgi:hypothetical protein